MIVVDSSVWIANLRNTENLSVRKLAEVQNPSNIIVGDIVLLEVLQGARSDSHAESILSWLQRYRICDMSDKYIAIKAAANFRHLRNKGITIRKTMDLIIGTFCIENNHQLLHDDRDFAPMEEHLGLQIY